MIVISLAIVGWFIQSNKQRHALLRSEKLQRQLQRKSVAVSLLTDNRFQPPWVDGLRYTFRKVMGDKKFNWGDFGKRRFTDNDLTEEEKDIYHHLKTVLNCLEFTAVAVLNGAADEDIVRWSYGFYYEELNHKLREFFVESRGAAKDPSMWCHFTELADRWDNNQPDLARNTDQEY